MTVGAREKRSTGVVNHWAESMRLRLEESLRPLLPPGGPVALLDFPVYPNVGDSAIWLGAVATLRQLGMRTPHYACSFKTYSRPELARRLGDGTILLSGGGNFGDRYAPHQRFREAVIADFPGRQIIQLPQSIDYESREAIERTRRVLGGHRRFTLLVRDEQSLAFARREFSGVASALCTDMAFGLGALAPPRAAADQVLWLARDDQEAAAGRSLDVLPGVVREDWAGLRTEGAGSIIDRLRRRVRDDAGMMRWLHGPVANNRLRRGVWQLSGARRVVTDRLHAHILCVLLGIPHWVLPNRTGKVRAFYDSWTHPSPLVHWCEDAGDAQRQALADR